jgi:hypothetical protein
MRGWDNGLEQFAGGEVADESAVCGEEFVVGEFFEPYPLQLVEDFVLQLAIEGRDREELQVDGSAVAVVVADSSDALSDPGVDAQFFLEFANEGLFRAFALLDLSAGKLPLQGHRLVGAALADQDQSVANQQTCHNKAKGRTRRARWGDGLRFFHASSVNACDKYRSDGRISIFHPLKWCRYVFLLALTEMT